MKQLLITGANRGIGLEFTQQYLANGWRVYATYRNETGDALTALDCEQLTMLPLDVTNDASISALQTQLDGVELDLIINNAGIYGPRQQALSTVSRQQWLEVFNVNSVAPLLIAQALHGNLVTNKGTFAVISSKMGSIDDNDSGSLYLYRSSKTAVNQVVKSLSIDLTEMGIKVVALHPGWVRTDMGGPNGLIDTSTSVNGLRQVLKKVTTKDSGHFFNYDGTEIPW
ncbi:MAG: SDR family oxidoreductase [Gammaproteobacteria bacterium]|nr:SDR family oxidoreductase [Gammaproteobacteria bacterium]